MLQSVGEQLEKYFLPSANILHGRPPSYTLHCIAQRLTFDLLSWKLAHHIADSCPVEEEEEEEDFT